MNRQMTNDGIEPTKSNVMLIVPTGTGKTLLAKILAHMLDLPFAVLNVTPINTHGC